MVTIFQNLHSDKQFKASTGLSIADFDILFSFFDKLYFPKEGNPFLSADKQPVLQNKREALFFILHYLKAYPTLVNMGLYFGMSESCVSRYIELLKPYLKAALIQSGEGICRTYKSEQDFEQTFKDVEDLLIDVFEIPVQRPVDYEKQEKVYSGEKKVPYFKMASDK